MHDALRNVAPFSPQPLHNTNEAGSSRFASQGASTTPNAFAIHPLHLSEKAPPKAKEKSKFLTSWLVLTNTMVEKATTSTGALERSRSRYKSPWGKIPTSVCEPPPQRGNVEASKQRTSQGERTQRSELHSPRSPVKTPMPSTAPSTKSSLASRTSRESSKTKAKSEDRPPEVTLSRPTFDAPISAVNAGERRVSIRHDQTVLSVPISPTTTPYDIVRAASVESSPDISPDDHVLLESYTPLGLERPLRKYEHIRDLLNSWDSDTQNTLVLVPSFLESMDINLNLEGVLEQPPAGASVQMYHSQRPGQWDKKWINLRADGQISVAKNGVSSNICHLSDFDIYMPTKTRLCKYIRPPKRFCFAIKSQQKSSIFLSNQNFVHLFSTNDKTLANHFYSSVQIWRSWYLVHVMGQRAEDSSLGSSSVRGPRSNSDQTRQGARLVRQTHGLTEPAEGHTRTEQHQDEFDWACTVPTGGDWAPHCRSHDPMPIAGGTVGGDGLGKQDHETTTVKPLPLGQPDAEPFAATGLLGKAYTQRRAAQRERENAHVTEQDQSSQGRAAIGSSLARATTQRTTRPKPPLVQMPEHREGPQHRQGKRFGSESAPAHSLINAATKLSQRVRLPLDLRSPEENEAIRRRLTVRDANQESHQKGVLPNASRSSNLKSEEKRIFKTGLLANIDDRGQGHLGHGAAARPRDHNFRGPMISLEEGPQYAPGSLLASVQRYQGINKAPVVERGKRKEIDIAVGEAE